MRSRLAMLFVAASMPLVLALPASAQTTNTPVITKIHVANVHVNTGACVYTKLMTSFDTYGFSIDSFDTQIWHGSRYLDTEGYWPSGDTASQSSGSVADDYLYCPYEGLGSFKATPTTIDYHDVDYNNFHVSDSAVAYFTAKEAARSVVTAVTSGSSVLVSGKVRYFNVNTDAWQLKKNTTVVFQSSRHLAGPWTTIAKVSTGTKGVARLKHHYSGQYWRLVYHGDSRTWASTSGPKLPG